MSHESFSNFFNIDSLLLVREQIGYLVVAYSESRAEISHDLGKDVSVNLYVFVSGGLQLLKELVYSGLEIVFINSLSFSLYTLMQPTASEELSVSILLLNDWRQELRWIIVFLWVSLSELRAVLQALLLKSFGLLITKTEQFFSRHLLDRLHMGLFGGGTF